MTLTREHVPTIEGVDTGALLSAYRSSVTPAAKDFIECRISANELRERWLAYFRGSFLVYEIAVHDAWRSSFGPDRGIEPGPPHADPKFIETLRVFPVTISHNNLERLIDVLAVELGDRTADAIGLRERLVDFAFVVDELDRLMSTLTLAA